MHLLTLFGTELQLLPEKAIYVQSQKTLLVSDIHLGKSETFQSFGIPIPNQINHVTLKRLQAICDRVDLDHLFILGDLFHSKFALVDEVLEGWFSFIKSVNVSVRLIIGNHDRALVSKLQQLKIDCILDAIQIDNLILSHEPCSQNAGLPKCLNICGHLHPCIRIKTSLDSLRLPCFYLDHAQNQLILPAFGEFTGGYDMPLKSDSTAYVVVENSVIPFDVVF